ncbi:MAG: uracil-DNA glycosylase [Clostridiales bacterium]|nr:uracil-DNA glycosylase [Clostridiales bacterium]MCI2161830.1 uracil-DNA glycosylase [Oscillospiraceae bacterium]MCI1960835.1 uracil-DNA glycosylase [Clostridiales bacterium]MCI2021276.1 uracil-DNA glycosylase [Clostridiales bacterium]MCI2025659.1 uracil-DNA glycosylase [Clostridiales bacterium]
MYENWETLKSACLECQKCDLCKGRTNLVFGVGNPQSKVLFVGEGPGEQEDLKGEPFVGRSGQLLDKYLDAVGLDRHKNIYIANIVKCRPPKNRDPLPEEQDACISWLRNQTALMRPKILVCLGRIAAQKIINPNLRITKEHGQWTQKGEMWMTATLHPAALLRDPRKKPDAFEDFLSIRKKMEELKLIEPMYH